MFAAFVDFDFDFDFDWTLSESHTPRLDGHKAVQSQFSMVLT